MNTTYLTANEMTAKSNLHPESITFSNANTWVMRITADRRIEVNEGVAVSDAAQAVLDALAPMLKKPWVGLTDAEMRKLFDEEINKKHANWLDVCRAIEAKLKEKNRGDT